MQMPVPSLRGSRHFFGKNEVWMNHGGHSDSGKKGVSVPCFTHTPLIAYVVS